MLYRPFRPADFEPLYAIEELCFQPPLRFSRNYMRRLIASSRSATWIAEDDGDLTGFAIVVWNSLQTDRAAYIQTIEVAPEARRKGIGNELLQRAEHSAVDAGASLIWLHVDAGNGPAIRLYESHGYQLKGREEHYYARGRDALIYDKSLGNGVDAA